MLFFSHLPKCGGNSFSEIFSENINVLCGWQCPESGHSSGTMKYLGQQVRMKYRCRFRQCETAIRNMRQDRINFLTHHRFPREKKSSDVIISSIRNPFSWYVSRWSYGKENSAAKTMSFRNFCLNNQGLYSRRFTECCREFGSRTGKVIVDDFIRLEHFNEDLEKIRDKIGIPFKKNSNIHANKSQHESWQRYYLDRNSDLLELILKADSQIFELFPEYKNKE